MNFLFWKNKIIPGFSGLNWTIGVHANIVTTIIPMACKRLFPRFSGVFTLSHMNISEHVIVWKALWTLSLLFILLWWLLTPVLCALSAEFWIAGTVPRIKSLQEKKKNRIWVTLMVSSVKLLHLPRPEMQGTLSSINEENVPVGMVFVKPNYIRSAGKVRINLSNPFWMCRKNHIAQREKKKKKNEVPWRWLELAKQKYCAAGRHDRKHANMLTSKYLL